MSVETNHTFTLGETWDLEADFVDDDGAALDLTDAVVALRLSRRKLLVLALASDDETPSGEDVAVAIGSPPAGTVAITVTPDAQSAAGLFAAVYDYEVRATFADDGRIVTQGFGAITVRPSLFS